MFAQGVGAVNSILHVYKAAGNGKAQRKAFTTEARRATEKHGAKSFGFAEGEVRLASPLEAPLLPPPPPTGAGRGGGGATSAVLAAVCAASPPTLSRPRKGGGDASD